MKTIVISTALVIIAMITGCTKDNQGSMITGSTAPQITVTPSDGATYVRLDAPVTLTFAKAVDRSITERNLHLFSQKDMDDSTCPMSMMLITHGMMNPAMIDSTMMNHLIAQHGTHGRFQWNGGNTTCSFLPDSRMMPNMSYMVHMGREMTQMMEERMGSMGMMGDHGAGMMSGDMMYHFRTMDTTSTGSGHDGHH